MARFEQTIQVPYDAAMLINHYLYDDIMTEDMAQGEDNTIIYTADFGNGIQMDIKCCGVQFHEDTDYYGPNNSWTEAVLFLNGCEVNCSEPEEEFLGEWELEYGGNEYVVNVVA